MQLKSVKKQATDENLIPLINIVFLILIFFLIATVIRPFSAKNIDLATTDAAEKLHRLTLSLTIDKEGILYHKNKTVTLDELKTGLLGNTETNTLETSTREISKTTEQQDEANTSHSATETKTLTLIADRELKADKLLEIVSGLNDIKFKSIKLITEDKSR